MEAIEAGTLIAEKYLLVRQIGRGGMGSVWAAKNTRTEREVALKLITDENKGYRERLLREARACGRISHRNVIEIYDVGETLGGAPFLVMPLLDGEPLSRRLRRERVLQPAIAAQIATEIARALSAAHAAGIVHRDLKPANVFLHREPGSDQLVVKVLDFGISKVVESDSTTTTTGTILGSPAYMSPEQAKGERYVDHRSDLWSLGVTLFEMLTGKRPFIGESMFTVVAAVLSGPIPRVAEIAPYVPVALSEVVARCMERELSRRAQSADEIAVWLRPFAAGYLPVDLQFGASGVHPPPVFTPPSGISAVGSLSDSASVPPVHFAAQLHGPPPPPGARGSMPSVPAARGSMPSISGASSSTMSASISTASISLSTASITPEPGSAQPFSGSTTAAGAMVHQPSAAPPAPMPVAPEPPRAPSRAAFWALGVVAFVSIAALVGVLIGVSGGGGSAGDAPSSGATSGAGPGVTASAAPLVTVSATPSATASAAPSSSATAEPSATASASSGRVDFPYRGPGGSGTSTKPVGTGKGGGKTGGGVSVPDDPG